MPPLCRRSSGRAGSFLAKHTLDPQPGATGRPRNRDGQSVVQRQPQRSSWTRNRTTRPESGEPRWMVPRHTVDAHRNQYPEKPGSWLRRIQVAITAGHRGNRGNASAGKHGDHQARAARAGVVVVEIRLDSVVPGTGCRQADNGVVVDRPVRGYEERPDAGLRGNRLPPVCTGPLPVATCSNNPSRLASRCASQNASLRRARTDRTPRIRPTSKGVRCER